MKETRKKFQRSVEFTGDINKDGIATGVANTMGVIDAYTSVFYPGAFSFDPQLIPDFLKNGITTYAHQLRQVPVAYPKALEEVGNSLMYTFGFHLDNTEAMDLYTVCRDRMEMGMNVGLSVLGWFTEIMFPSGEALLADAEERGRDMSFFDTEAIKRHTDIVFGIPRVYELKEICITMMPASPGSYLNELRSRSIEPTDFFKRDSYTDDEKEKIITLGRQFENEKYDFDKLIQRTDDLRKQIN